LLWAYGFIKKKKFQKEIENVKKQSDKLNPSYVGISEEEVSVDGEPNVQQTSNVTGHVTVSNDNQNPQTTMLTKQSKFAKLPTEELR